MLCLERKHLQKREIIIHNQSPNCKENSASFYESADEKMGRWERSKWFNFLNRDKRNSVEVAPVYILDSLWKFPSVISNTLTSILLFDIIGATGTLDVERDAIDSKARSYNVL